MEIRYILNVNYIKWITLTYCIFLYNVTPMFGYNNTIVMERYSLKNSWFSISCLLPNAPSNYFDYVLTYRKRGSLEYLFKFNSEFDDAYTSYDKSFKPLSTTRNNVTGNFTKVKCSHTREFVCDLSYSSDRWGSDESAKNHTVIDNTHKVMLTKTCNTPEIKCKTCRKAGVDVIVAKRTKFQLSCSTMMSFPTNHPNPYRFRWFIDRFNNGTYKEIKKGFTNSVPLTNKKTNVQRNHCVPLEKKTSVFTFHPSMTNFTSIHVKCQVVLEIEKINETKETTTHVCLCPKSDPHRVLLTHKKFCSRFETKCKTCKRPNVDVVAAARRWFQLSCSSLIIIDQESTYKFQWSISYPGTYRKIKQGLSKYNVSSECGSLKNITSVFTFKPKITNSPIINVTCRVVYKDRDFTKRKQAVIQICLCQNNDTDKIMMTHHKDKCDKANIYCENCRRRGVDVTQTYGKSFNLSCSALMPFFGRTTSNRFLWYIDHSNNGSYKKSTQGISNFNVLSNNLTKRQQQECVSLENITSVFTFNPKMTNSTIINVKCQVVFDDEDLTETNDTIKRICLCKNNNTDEIRITHQKDECGKSDINCKTCRRPEIDVIKTFGESFNLSCSAVMPFLGNQRTPNRFLWFINDSNSGKFSEISQGFTNAVPSIDNTTENLQPQCVSFSNMTSVLTYKPAKSNSKFLIITCQVVLGIDYVTEQKERNVQVCLYKKGVRKRFEKDYFPLYTSVPAALMVIVLAVVVVVAFKHRRKKSIVNKEEKQQENTDNDTKASTDNNKASPGHSAYDYDPSKKTKNKSHTYDLDYTITKSIAADNVSDMATLKMKRKQKSKTSKDDNRSTKTKRSKMGKMDGKSIRKSLKAKASSEYTYNPLPSKHGKSKRLSKTSENTITYSQI